MASGVSFADSLRQLEQVVGANEPAMDAGSLKIRDRYACGIIYRADCTDMCVRLASRGV